MLTAEKAITQHIGSVWFASGAVAAEVKNILLSLKMQFTDCM